MSDTSINVNKQCVKAFLETGKEKQFLIPDYQRPYDWTSDEVDTLFNDVWNFAKTRGGSTREATYFLGCVVSYIKDGKQEIIDGQQRITSLTLLLRAIYTKLQASSDENAANFRNEIEPTLWLKNKLNGKIDFSAILLESKVISDKDRESLHTILRTGVAPEGATDKYSKNYNQFVELYEKASKDDALQVYDFIYALLNQVIVMPITADTQETALTIFTTLNDRGRPLSDADIFKAQIYNRLPDAEKKEAFIKSWKELSKDAEEAGESIQRLFYYYMFYLRALESDVDTTTPGVRRYYLEEKKDRLHKQDLMSNLKAVLGLFQVVNSQAVVEGEAWSSDMGVLKALDVLSSYPNEFWKYPVVTYYLKYRGSDDFAAKFLLFIRKMIVELLPKYLETHTINSVKTGILKLNTAIISSDKPTFDFNVFSNDDLRKQSKTPHSNAVRMLLKLLAYDEQDTLLPSKWEIEHILPQKWQKGYFPNNPDEEVKEKIEHLGNKVPFEKKLNIEAGNNYFTKKKDLYKESKVAVTKAIGENESLEVWGLDSIIERDVAVAESVVSILDGWRKDYAAGGAVAQLSVTAEQQALIDQLKATGFDISALNK
ncbi:MULTISPECIES: DUF262 domain-containing protein [unclassified Fibrobacter]|uniref:DUF262 domain-containing protein n=1 Tax=unclassified Fibrobacter TaxID=2634177 RepID=UPI00091348FE|nr:MULTISPECIES: DUF262 domain-containing protein [unclassified Fibrobacter]OWV06993.1 hypothetical protein B7993_04325 [Fibrobacter sp. UWH3]SHK24628.1 Protein of unknown function [Fibrobacter sp. UWH6]